MVTKNKIFGYLGLCMKAGKLAFGTEAVIESLEKRKAKMVLMASDCSERTQKKFQEITEQYQIPLFTIGTIEEISNAIGKDNKSVVSIKDSNIAKEIERIINGGDTIG